MRLSIKISIASLLFALSSVAALAEKADRSQPVNLEADSVTVDDRNKVSVYQGNVSLVQGTMSLQADRIEVRQDAAGFDKATAFGNPVKFRQKQEGKDEYIEGYAKRVEYDGKQSKLELLGDARLKKGADVLNGNYISYNANTEFFEVKGTGTPGAPGSSRVRAVIQPKNTTPAEATPLPPLKPMPAIKPVTR
jgi:lipopolysaccharide export system protein LptA